MARAGPNSKSALSSQPSNCRLNWVPIRIRIWLHGRGRVCSDCYLFWKTVRKFKCSYPEIERILHSHLIENGHSYSKNGKTINSSCLLSSYTITHMNTTERGKLTWEFRIFGLAIVYFTKLSLILLSKYENTWVGVPATGMECFSIRHIGWNFVMRKYLNRDLFSKRNTHSSSKNGGLWKMSTSTKNTKHCSCNNYASFGTTKH